MLTKREGIGTKANFLQCMRNDQINGSNKESVCVVNKPQTDRVLQERVEVTV